MKQIDDTRIEKMILDIETIREVLSMSRPSIQLLLLPEHFRAQSLILGISIFIIAGAYHLLRLTYGAHGDIPELYRYIFYGVILVDWIFLGTIKLRNWSKSLSTKDPEFNIRRALLQFVTFRTIHAYLLFFFTLVFFVTYQIITGDYYAIIPTLSIGIGLILNFLGNLTDIWHYIVSGLWMIIWGFIIIAAGTIPGAIAIILSMGVGCVIFGIHGYILPMDSGNGNG